MSDEAFVVRWHRFFNSTGATIPPFACLTVVNTVLDNNGVETYYQIRKPTYDDEQSQDPARFVFNNGVYIPNNTYGTCSSDMPAAALVDETDSPSAGEVVGPVEDEWYLATGRNAFVLKAKHNDNPHQEGTARVWGVEVNISEAEIVRVVSNAPVDGYYDGFVQRFDVLTKTWFNVRACKVRDANQ